MGERPNLPAGFSLERPAKKHKEYSGFSSLNYHAIASLGADCGAGMAFPAPIVKSACAELDNFWTNFK